MHAELSITERDSLDLKSTMLPDVSRRRLRVSPWAQSFKVFTHRVLRSDHFARFLPRFLSLALFCSLLCYCAGNFLKQKCPSEQSGQNKGVYHDGGMSRAYQGIGEGIAGFLSASASSLMSAKENGAVDIRDAKQTQPRDAQGQVSDSEALMQNRPSNSATERTPTGPGTFLGTCYEECEDVRNLLLGPDFDVAKVVRLRSVTCVRFIPGRGFCDSFISKGRMEEDVFTEEYLQEGRNFFGNVSRFLPPSLGGSIVFMPSDSTNDLMDSEIEKLWRNKTPFLPHSILIRETTNYIMMPDFHFLKEHGFKDFREELAVRDRPFFHRKSTVFWRGSSTSEGLDCSFVEERKTGDSFTESGCATTTRVQIALRALRLPHLDAKIIGATDCCRDQTEGMSEAGIMGERVEEIKWTTYRGILEVDGLVNAWGFFWRLYSGSVVFRVESNYLSFYSERLIPWVHFIPLRADLSDLEAKTALVVSKKPEDIDSLSKIAKEARSVLRNLTYESEIQRIVEKLTNVWQA